MTWGHSCCTPGIYTCLPPCLLAAELQACASAASEKIAHLEEEAESAQATHEQTLDGLKQELQAAQACSYQVQEGGGGSFAG